MKSGPADGDNSNSQYAALGLRACFESGVDIPEEVIVLAVKWWREAQHVDPKKDKNGKEIKQPVASGISGKVEGWNYKRQGTDERGPYHAMTAGGVASLAPPPAELTDDDFRTLAGFGRAALEVEYPWGRHSRVARLREAAGRLGLAVTGGSDCHGPDSPHRRIGSHAVTADELAALRDRRDRPNSGASRN